MARSRTTLSGETGLDVKFITGLSYDTINKMLEAGTLDVGFVCGAPYVTLHDQEKPAANLLVAPVMKDARYGGKPKYFSDLIVHKDSTFAKLADLEGKRFVYNDELSNSGYNLPRFHLLRNGYNKKQFFGSTARSGSHEESIRMVAKGEADASFVDSLVLEYDRNRKVGDAAGVKVIESVGPAGIPPVVVSPAMAQDVRAKLEAAFVHMHENPQGRAILDRADVDRFVVTDDANYDDIRSMKKAAEQAGFVAIK
jgi:phosphonate transport system substrate-binding protein